MGLNFTLSHPVTAAIPPGDERLFSLALELATQFSPLTQEETIQIKERALKGKPIFSYPSSQA
jgi:hypothetical protein